MSRPPVTNDRSICSRRLRLAALLIIMAMCCTEVVNCGRIWRDPKHTWKFPVGYASKGLYSFGAFVRPPDNFNVDIAPILNASVRMLTRDTNQYWDFQISGPNNFYPPSAAFIFAPFGLMVQARAGDLSLATQIIDVLSRICVAITLVAILWRLQGITTSRKQMVAVLLMLASFFPLRWMLLCVQAQSFVTLLLVFSIIAYARSYTFMGGLLMGLAGCIKPHFALIGLFAVFRKEWGYLFGMFLSSFCILLGTLILTGFTPWETYITKVIPIMSRGYAFYPNQSINGIVHRWLGHDTKYAFAPMTSIVFFSNLFSAVVFYLLAVCPRLIKFQNKYACDQKKKKKSSAVREGIVLRELDLGIAILCIIFGSPIVWEHHFAWTIILFAICLQCAHFIKEGQVFLYWLAFSYFLLGTYLLPVQSASSGLLSLVNSHIFWGALMLLFLTWYVYIQVYNTLYGTTIKADNNFF